LNSKIIEKRQIIDDIDLNILELIEKRVKIVIDIANIKKEFSLPSEDMNRENEIFESIFNNMKIPMDKNRLKKIYKDIIMICKKEAY